MDAPRSPTDREQAVSAAPEPSSLPSATAAPEPADMRSKIVAWWRQAKPTVLFLASWTLLDLMLNVRYPQEEPAFWYLLPSVDVLVLFFYFAVFGWNKWRVPVAVRVALVAFVFLVRVVRLGDGIQRRYYFQPFNMYGDL